MLYEDPGFDQYQDANLYGCYCPDCRLLLMEFSDNDVDVEDPSQDKIREALRERNLIYE